MIFGLRDAGGSYRSSKVERREDRPRPSPAERRCGSSFFENRHQDTADVCDRLPSGTPRVAGVCVARERFCCSIGAACGCPPADPHGPGEGAGRSFDRLPSWGSCFALQAMISIMMGKRSIPLAVF